MAAGFISEWWPASNRNGGRLHVGKPGRNKSESATVDQKNFFEQIKKQPAAFLIIHYSSENLYDEGLQGLSPRITSIVVMHYDAGQIRSFSLHTIAEQLNISKDQVAANYDAIESRLLTDFYGFVKSTKDKYWVHWQMKSRTFGFEHLEHRYTYLTKNLPTPIPVENRINLVDCLRHKYGDNFAPQVRYAATDICPLIELKIAATSAKSRWAYLKMLGIARKTSNDVSRFQTCRFL